MFLKFVLADRVQIQGEAVEDRTGVGACDVEADFRGGGLGDRNDSLVADGGLGCEFRPLAVVA